MVYWKYLSMFVMVLILGTIASGDFIAGSFDGVSKNETTVIIGLSGTEDELDISGSEPIKLNDWTILPLELDPLHRQTWEPISRTDLYFSMDHPTFTSIVGNTYTICSPITPKDLEVYTTGLTPGALLDTKITKGTLGNDFCPSMYSWVFVTPQDQRLLIRNNDEKYFEVWTNEGAGAGGGVGCTCDVGITNAVPQIQYPTQNDFVGNTSTWNMSVVLQGTGLCFLDGITLQDNSRNDFIRIPGSTTEPQKANCTGDAQDCQRKAPSPGTWYSKNITWINDDGDVEEHDFGMRTIWECDGVAFSPKSSSTISMNVTHKDLTPPNITWEDPTPTNGSTVEEDNIFLNTTVVDDTSDAVSFIDWNNTVKGYWPFERVLANGTTWDYSSYGQHGVLTLFATNTSATWIGKYGDALVFDNTNDYVDILDSVAGGHAYTTIGDNLTLSAWINPSSVSGSAGSLWINFDTLIEMRTETASETKVTFNFGVDASKIGLGVADNHTTGAPEQNWDKVRSNTTITPNNWQHIAVTVNDDIYQFYLNGVPDGNGSFTYALGNRSVGSTTANMQIGLRSRNGGQKDVNMWGGYADEILVVERTLNETEIYALYNNTGNNMTVNMTDLDGTYNYTAYAIDEYGNRNESQQSVIVSLGICGTSYNGIGDWFINGDVTCDVDNYDQRVIEGNIIVNGTYLFYLNNTYLNHSTAQYCIQGLNGSTMQGEY